MDLFDQLILAALVQQAYGRGNDSTFIEKLGAQYREARALADAISSASRGSGPKTDSGVPHTDARTRMLRVLEDAWRNPAAGERAVE